MGVKDQLNVCIKSPDIPGVFYTRLTGLAKQLEKTGKGLTLGKQEVRYKQTKKMRIIRRFERKKSVFKDFIDVTDKMLGQAFDLDMQYIKTHKFIKPGKDGLPETELDDVHNVLRKHFAELKDQYIS